jgi:hypothetical protein
MSPRHAKAGDRTNDRAARARGRPPADASGQGLLGRMRALAESVRRQLAARRQNRTRAGGPGDGLGPR